MHKDCNDDNTLILIQQVVSLAKKNYLYFPISANKKP